MTHYGYAAGYATPEDIAPREFRAATPPEDQSIGSRLGIVHRYGYGESRPELRPQVTD